MGGRDLKPTLIVNITKQTLSGLIWTTPRNITNRSKTNNNIPLQNTTGISSSNNPVKNSNYWNI